MVKLQESSGSLLQSSGSLKPADSLRKPFSMGEDDAVSAMRLEDLVSSACAADAVNRLVSARAQDIAQAVQACPTIPESPAVAALEAAACSLAQNLKSVLARSQPTLQSQRSWSSYNGKVSSACMEMFSYHCTGQYISYLQRAKHASHVLVALWQLASRQTADN